VADGLADSRGSAAGRRLLFLLFLIGVFNAADRRIIVVLLEPIRLEFGASDTAMGFLTGFAFVLFYSLATLPIARLADARPRRTLILIGLSCWSAMTALCGAVTSFWQLAVARVGVGVGEASYLPAGMSMVSDRFPQDRRPVALAVFSVSFPVGMMLAMIVGGSLGQTLGWRPTFLWVGGVGLAVAVLAAFLLEEPDRGHVEKPSADRALYGMRDTIAYLWALRSFRHLAAGGALAMFAATSMGTWGPTFLIRLHGLDIARAGAMLGLATGVGGIAGIFVLSAAGQRLARRDGRWLLWMPALIQLVACPFVALFLRFSDPRTAAAAFVPVAMSGAGVIPLTMAAAQGLAKVRMRALGAALVSFAVNLAGIGLGPFVAGVASDLIEPRFGPESLRYALFLNGLVMLWAGAHFVIAARTLRDELARARGDEPSAARPRVCAGGAQAS
jgi:predicted MFS family arabinose efflux permease